MNTKITLIILFVIVAIIQLAVPAKMIYTNDLILSKGKPYKFQIVPIDSHTPVWPAYLNITFKEDSLIDKSNSWKRQEDIFVLLDFDKSTGFTKVKAITREKPQSNIEFVKAKVAYTNGANVFIHYPFNRFYLEESKNPNARFKYTKALKDSNKINYLLVNSIDGEVVINDLIINGVSIKKLKIH